VSFGSLVFLFSITCNKLVAPLINLNIFLNTEADLVGGICVQRVFITIQFKKLILTMIVAMILMVLLSILLVGIGNKDGKLLKDSSEFEKYSLTEENIQLKNNEENNKIRVYITKGNKIAELDIEEYVRGVVAAEMPAAFDLEALKAQAVAARTYGLAHMEQFGGTKKSTAKGADVCDTVNSQVYISKQEALSKWNEKDALLYWNKVTDAVNQTSGQVLTYEGKLVMSPYYFAFSSGKTENVVDVFGSDTPYLRSVKSEGDKEVKNFQVSTKYTYAQLASKINSQYPKAAVSAKNLKSQISILQRTSGGESVKSIKIGNSTITGSQFREMLDLRSSNFSIKFNSKDIEIICKGYGHGVGMSQWGAAAMAKDGSNYIEILTHYYQGVKINNIVSLK
jgi:stage II sporulation protein D